LNKIDDMAPAEYKIEYLIATVPDPKDSRLDYMFDRYLEVIQLAIGEAGYTFDHYWLPCRLNIMRDFVMRVLIHGVVPIIALLGAQFPQAVRQIFSWLSVFEGKGS